MLRYISLLLLLGLLVVPSWAEVYRCRAADGRLIFTDDPAQFPPDCRELRPDEEPEGGISFVPQQSEPPAPPADQPSVAGDAGQDGQSRERGSSLRAEADALAREYQEVVVHRIPTLPPAEVQRAREQTVEIMKQRDELLRRLAAAKLSDDEETEIIRLLAPIPKN